MFLELGITVVVAALLGLVVHLLRQPTVIAYIATGLILGTGGFGIVTDHTGIEVLGRIGVIFLLFLVGLELDWRKLARTGWAATAVGLGQMVLATVASWLLVRWLGFPPLEAWYLALALAFSSTVIVIDILDSRQSLGTIQGRLLIGVLLVQDLVAILALILLATVGDGSTVSSIPVLLGSVLAKATLLVAITMLVGRYVMPFILDSVQRASDLQTLVALGWAFLLTGLASLMGLSVEIGALLAGVSLAALPQGLDIGLKIRPIRNFFLMLFFVSLGLLLSGAQGVDWTVLLGLAAFVVIAKPLIFYLLYGGLGFRPRTAFLASLPAAQISEFSLIVVAVGVSLGHLADSHLALVTGVAIVTFFVSTYLGTHSEYLYERMRPLLIWPNRHRAEADDEQAVFANQRDHIVLVGGRTLGGMLQRWAKEQHRSIVTLDLDPQIVRTLSAQGGTVLLGDAGEPEVLRRVGYERALLGITTSGQFEANRDFVMAAKEVKRSVPVYAIARSTEEALGLYEAGADYVVVPHHVSGDVVVRVMEEAFAHPGKLATLRKSHITELAAKSIDRRRSHHRR